MVETMKQDHDPGGYSYNNFCLGIRCILPTRKAGKPAKKWFANLESLRPLAVVHNFMLKCVVYSVLNFREFHTKKQCLFPELIWSDAVIHVFHVMIGLSLKPTKIRETTVISRGFLSVLLQELNVASDCSNWDDLPALGWRPTTQKRQNYRHTERVWNFSCLW